MKRTQFGFRKMREPIPYNGPEAGKARTVEVFDSIDEKMQNEGIWAPVARTPAPLHRGTYGPATLTPVAKAPSPVRSETYRRLVAALPCYQCGIQGFSQAAHPNTNKAKGMKASDLDCFPLCCTRPGIQGCHFLYDSGRLIERSKRAEYEEKAKAWTQAEILRLT